MPSVWIATRPRKHGTSYRVFYRLGGHGTPTCHGGQFRTQRDAQLRKRWIAGELASMRVPDLRLLHANPPTAPTVREAGERWLASRIDAAAASRVRLGVDLERVLRVIGDRRIDELVASDVADLIAALDTGYKPSTIKKSREVLAMVLDYAGIAPNPARDRQVKLPRRERVELSPPTAAHVEAVYRVLPSQHRLPFLWLEWSGARVSTVDTVRVSDYDERLRRVRLRSSASKTGRALWVDLPPPLAEAIEATLPPKIAVAGAERDPEAPLFPDTNEAALRRAITRACVATGTPTFSPHDLRHRRVSVLHAQGRTWAEISAFVGHASKAVTADTYTHVIADPTEVDLAALLDAGSGRLG
jgi:integrase